MKRMKVFLCLVAAGSLLFCPLHAEDEGTADAAPRTELTMQDAKAKKKRAAAKKARAKLRFKWCKSLKAALATAKKYNTTCLVVFSNPAGCPYCIKLEAEVFQNRKFKAAKGIGVGYQSTEPIEEFGLIDGMPSAVIVGPDGRPVGGQLGYVPESDNLAYYLKLLKEAQPAWDGEPEEEEETP